MTEQNQSIPNSDLKEDSPQEDKENSGEQNASDSQDAPEELSALDQAKAEADEFKNKYLYQLAEVKNLKMRMERDRSDLLKFGSERIIKELLPVLDNLERALSSSQNTTGDEGQGEATQGLKEGVQMICQQFEEALSKFGVQKIEAKGQEFNPEFHEAVGQEKATSEDQINQIVQVHQKGFLLNGRLLRPARVVVAK